MFYNLLQESVGAVGMGRSGACSLTKACLMARISRPKRKHRVEFLIPVLSKTDVQVDAMSVKERVSFEPYQPTQIQQCPQVVSEAPKGDKIVKTELSHRRTLGLKKPQRPGPSRDTSGTSREFGFLRDFGSWCSCTLLLLAAYCRPVCKKGRDDTWLLLDTGRVLNPFVVLLTHPGDIHPVDIHATALTLGHLETAALRPSAIAPFLSEL